LKIEQYFQIQDYALWDVVENGNSFVPVTQATTAEGSAITTTISSPVTAKEKIKKKNDVKAKSMLLMALLNKHLMTFNKYKDAKSLFAAIEIRFGDNEATKMTHKTILKQMYENFSATSTENKPDLDTMSIDDLYNNFKIVEQEVKVTESSNSSSQNMAFVSSPSITVLTKFILLMEGPRNQDSGNRYQDSSRRTMHVEETPPNAMVAIDEVSFDWSYMAEDEVPTNLDLMAFLDSGEYTNNTCSKTCLKSYETLKKQYDNLKIDLNKVEFELIVYKKGLASIEEKLIFYKNNMTTLCENIAVLTRDMSIKKQYDDLKIDLNKVEFELVVYKKGLASIEEQLIFYKNNMTTLYENNAVLTRDMSIKDVKINVPKSELENIKQEKEGIQFKIEKIDNASKSLDKLLGSQITDKSKNSLGFQSYNAVPPSATLIYNIGRCAPPKTDLSCSGLEEFKQPEFESYGPNTCEIEVSDNKDCSVESTIVVEKKFVVPTIVKVEVVRLKQQENKLGKQLGMLRCTGHKDNYNNHQREMVVSRNNYTRVNYNNSTRKTHPNAHRNMAPREVSMKIGLRPLNTARPVNTAHPKTRVYSARPMPYFSNSAQSTGHPQKVQEDQRYVNSRCSRHMTGNMSYLSDFKEFNKGYVTFRGGENGGRITGKGTIKTNNLDFEDVYFVKELKFNLFSFSQMCDRKNNVLFIDTECLVLSPNFKLSDES
nr:hypothetical protein [Tanacetum cinerariifolium]